MKNRHYYLLLLLLFVGYSCTNEDMNSEDQVPNPELAADLSKIQVRDGRIYFPSKASFQSYFDELKDMPEEKVANIFDKKFYSKDFYSFNPVVNETTERLQVQRHLTSLRAKLRSGSDYITESTKEDAMADEDILEHIDDIEDLFGESVFTSFLNQEAEIHVDNKIYKYTDTGLFIVDEEEIVDLNKFLDDEGISRSLMQPTSMETQEDFLDTYNSCGGETMIDTFVHFVNPDDNDCGSGGSGGSGTGSGDGSGGGSGDGSGGSTGTIGTPASDLAFISQGLDECSGSEPFFANLFGLTKVCIDRYESGRRVKVKYYDVDLYLAYAVGIKVKHQKKGWTGIWRKQDTEEVALGINSISWNFQLPNVTDPLYTTAPPKIYVKGHGLYQSQNIGTYTYLGGHSLPQLPFNVDVIVEIGSNLPFGMLDTEQKVTEFFYEHTYDLVKYVVADVTGTDIKKMGLVLATPTSAWVQYYDFDSQCANCSKIERLLDWGAGTPTITYSFGGGTGGSVAITDWEFDFNTPYIVGVNAYGMAKRYGNWHGKRMVFEEK